MKKGKIPKEKPDVYQPSGKEKILFSQVICRHPVLYENEALRKAYYKKLVSYTMEIPETDYIAASLKLYRNKLNIETITSPHKISCPDYFYALFPLDIIAVSGYDKTLLASQEYQHLLSKMLKKSGLSESVQTAFRMLYQDFSSQNPAWKKLSQSLRKKTVSFYISGIRKNILFAEQKPFSILVTATMSAGKSTLINALAGKKIAKTMNEACTGKIHYIYHKPFEDGLVGKWVRKPVFDAEKRIISKKESEASAEISAESVYFSGMLGKERIALIDSPGVNSAIYQNHGEITEKMISSGNFDMVLYIINYTTDSTNDNFMYLQKLKKLTEDTVPVLFVVNKFDEYETEDFQPEQKIDLLKQDIEKAGFHDSKIYPVSAQTAFDSRTVFADVNFSETDALMKIMQNGESLKKFSVLQKLIQNENLHLEQYYHLPLSAQNAIQKLLYSAADQNDISSQALIHSGIYSLEAEIISYIKKKQKGKEGKN